MVWARDVTRTSQTHTPTTTTTTTTHPPQTRTSQLVVWARDVLHGLAALHERRDLKPYHPYPHLHERRIAHRDLKPANILPKAPPPLPHPPPS